MRRMVSDKQVEELIKQNSVPKLNQSDIELTVIDIDSLNITVPELYAINSLVLYNDAEETIMLIYDPINMKYSTSNSDVEGLRVSSGDLTNSLTISAPLGTDLSTFTNISRLTYLFIWRE